MVILIVADDASLKKRFESFFGSFVYTIIQYSHPLKALDNLDEIRPDVVVFSASDYPRHWKILAKEIRQNRKREDVAIILIVNAHFDSSEADKAAFLGANMLFSDGLETREDFQKIDKQISRYQSIPERSGVYTWIPNDEEPVSFIFQHPFSFALISGRFIEISSMGGIFRPDKTKDLDSLDTGMIIENGSMRAGEDILNIKARIIRNNRTISLTFIDFADNGLHLFLNEIALHLDISKSPNISV